MKRPDQFSKGCKPSIPRGGKGERGKGRGFEDRGSKIEDSEVIRERGRLPSVSRFARVANLFLPISGLPSAPERRPVCSQSSPPLESSVGATCKEDPRRSFHDRSLLTSFLVLLSLLLQTGRASGAKKIWVKTRSPNRTKSPNTRLKPRSPSVSRFARVSIFNPLSSILNKLPLALSPFHPLSLSPFHPFTLSPSRPLSLSPSLPLCQRVAYTHRKKGARQFVQIDSP